MKYLFSVIVVTYTHDTLSFLLVVDELIRKFKPI